MWKKYELMNNEFQTISIAKSWDIKFVIMHFVYFACFVFFFEILYCNYYFYYLYKCLFIFVCKSFEFFCYT
jgi:hypothetical protein